MSHAVDLTYDLDARPPPLVAIGAAFQIVAVVGIQVLNSLVIGRAAGLGPDALAELLRACFLTLGIGTLLQARRGPVGSGFLCANTLSSAFLLPGLMAARSGGMALVCGMAVFSGLLLVLLSRLLHRLRAFLPVEVMGVVVVLLGLSVGLLGVQLCLDAGTASQVAPNAILVAGLSLAIMIGLKVWGSGTPSLLCGLIGVFCGIALAVWLGMLPAGLAVGQAAERLLAMPTLAPFGWRFDAGLALPFAIATVASMFTTVGCILTAQKINDPHWVRAERHSIEGGVLSDGLTSIMAGLLGALPVNASNSAVGLTAATGITSRILAWPTSAILVLLGCSPKFAYLVEAVPPPVLGAALLFSACFILTNGVQIVGSRLLDARRSLVIGLACCAGLSTVVFPRLLGQVPPALLPLTASPLLLGTTVALALSTIFRIGIRKVANWRLEPDAALDEIETFLLAAGAAWGARRDVMQRASFAMSQAVEAVRDAVGEPVVIQIRVTFNELRLTVALAYTGPKLELAATPPSEAEILAEDGHLRLAGFVLARAANRWRATWNAGEAFIQFEFDH